MRGIIPVTGERHGQRGRHIQSKHSGINLHRAWILMPGQGLDDLLRLPVIKHVHDIAVPERVGRHRNRKVHPVSFSPFHGLLEPVPHGFICDGPQRFTPAGTGGDQPALHLPDIAYICQRDQTDLIFRRRPRRARTFSDSTRTKGRRPSRSKDSGVRVRASPIRIPVFHMVANSM